MTAHLRLVHDASVSLWDETRFPRPARKREHDIVIDWVEFLVMAGTIVVALTFASAAFLIAMGLAPGAYR